MAIGSNAPVLRDPLVAWPPPPSSSRFGTSPPLSPTPTLALGSNAPIIHDELVAWPPPPSSARFASPPGTARSPRFSLASPPPPLAAFASSIPVPVAQHGGHARPSTKPGGPSHFGSPQLHHSYPTPTSIKGKERAMSSGAASHAEHDDDDGMHSPTPRYYPPPRNPLTPAQLGRIAQTFGIVIPSLPEAPSPFRDRELTGSPRTGSYPRTGTPQSQAVAVIPPASLLVRQQSGSPDLSVERERLRRWRRGRLIPLQPTLNMMLVAIAHEFGLPSIAGITVYLGPQLPAESHGSRESSASYGTTTDLDVGPQISASAWSTLFPCNSFRSTNSPTNTPAATPKKALTSPPSANPSLGPLTPAPDPILPHTNHHHHRVRNISNPPESRFPSNSSQTSSSVSSFSPRTPASTTASIPPSTSLFGVIEFDVDPDEAPWFEGWLRSGGPSRKLGAEGAVRELALVGKLNDERPRFLRDLELEAERAEAERLEQQRLLEQQELERQEQERLEAQRIEQERLEQERLEQERLEAERLEAERLEQERLEAARLEQERLEAERLEQQCLEAERIENERLEAERLEQERLEAERLEQVRLEQERKVQEDRRLEAQRVEQERIEAQRLEQERIEQERIELQQRLERERVEEEERLKREQLEQERVREAEQREAATKAERERQQREMEEREQAELAEAAAAAVGYAAMADSSCSYDDDPPSTSRELNDGDLRALGLNRAVAPNGIRQSQHLSEDGERSELGDVVAMLDAHRSSTDLLASPIALQRPSPNGVPGLERGLPTSVTPDSPGLLSPQLSPSDHRGSGIVMADQLNNLEKLMRDLSPRDIHFNTTSALQQRRGVGDKTSPLNPAGLGSGFNGAGAALPRRGSSRLPYLQPESPRRHSPLVPPGKRYPDAHMSTGSASTSPPSNHTSMAAADPEARAMRHTRSTSGSNKLHHEMAQRGSDHSIKSAKSEAPKRPPRPPTPDLSTPEVPSMYLATEKVGTVKVPNTPPLGSIPVTPSPGTISSGTMPTTPGRQRPPSMSLRGLRRASSKVMLRPKSKAPSGNWPVYPVDPNRGGDPNISSPLIPADEPPIPVGLLPANPQSMQPPPTSFNSMRSPPFPTRSLPDTGANEFGALNGPSPEVHTATAPAKTKDGFASRLFSFGGRRGKDDGEVSAINISTPFSTTHKHFTPADMAAAAGHTVMPIPPPPRSHGPAGSLNAATTGVPLSPATANFEFGDPNGPNSPTSPRNVRRKPVPGLQNQNRSSGSASGDESAESIPVRSAAATAAAS
ncbi:hypothetical protein Q8F55_005110 [Vanrija albida]|uniref:Uncharacterized protein n=1 Tax=Vanrija albida TaxID=181172 RepID=A0ABR3Q0Q8_9TREE